MLRICAHKIKAFDVDDCLISQDPVFSCSVPVVCFGQTQMVYVNQDLVSKIKTEFANRTTIVVWSQQGDEWAEAVVKALNLEPYVHFVMTKVSECFDDLPVREWMKLSKIVIK